MNDLNDTEKSMVFVLSIAFFLFLNIILFATLGVVVAYFWNNFLIPNVDLILPVISWWQAAIGLWLIRTLKVVLFGK